ncbi:hypothetical protein TcasGA2_TC006478 [Tribolium castaneum]|uniref:Uncharacterized protein n=1 Tax=Tribolium castaneum TaxID=7070 RepID=D6WX38_TRICA|nr:hypothetical protein TcasGA2_TC006478 [Tribolium castaneum]
MHVHILLSANECVPPPAVHPTKSLSSVLQPAPIVRVDNVWSTLYSPNISHNRPNLKNERHRLIPCPEKEQYVSYKHTPSSINPCSCLFSPIPAIARGLSGLCETDFHIDYRIQLETNSKTIELRVHARVNGSRSLFVRPKKPRDVNLLPNGKDPRFNPTGIWVIEQVPLPAENRQYPVLCERVFAVSRTMHVSFGDYRPISRKMAKKRGERETKGPYAGIAERQSAGVEPARPTLYIVRPPIKAVSQLRRKVSAEQSTEFGTSQRHQENHKPPKTPKIKKNFQAKKTRLFRWWSSLSDCQRGTSHLGRPLSTRCVSAGTSFHFRIRLTKDVEMSAIKIYSLALRRRQIPTTDPHVQGELLGLIRWDGAGDGTFCHRYLQPFRNLSKKWK